MTLSTTPQIEGRSIVEYKGIVTGETIIGVKASSIRDFFGGRTSSYEKVLSEARDTSMAEMTQRAEKLGANAVIGIDIDYESISASMLMVSVRGTAVVLQP